MIGAGAVQVRVTGALVTVRLDVPSDAVKIESPAHVARMPVAYVPAAMAPRDTFASAATPAAFVSASPATVPLMVKRRVLPETGAPDSAPSSALRVTLPR